MMRRWTFKCLDGQTGEATTRTVVAKTEERAYEKLADLGLIVEQVITSEPVPTGASLPADDPGRRARASIPEPLERLLTLSWLALGLGFALCILGAVGLGADMTNGFANDDGRAMGWWCVWLGSSAFGFGVFSAVIGIAAKAICTCVLEAGRDSA